MIISDAHTVVYEEPVQERIRKFLRIESLFNNITYFQGSESIIEIYTAMNYFSELYEILSRSDIKSELIREIETHYTIFKKAKDHPDANTSKVNSILEKQEILLKDLYTVKTNFLDIYERDELFKIIIKNTGSTVQPSTIGFWLSRDSHFRSNQIKLWVEPLEFIKKSINFVLEIIRQSATYTDAFAEKGFYLQKMDLQKKIYLIRITLTTDHYYFPQISVGKQRLTIMFMTKNDKNKFIPYQEDITFGLSKCIL